jgi:hypothetical protein
MNALELQILIALSRMPGGSEASPAGNLDTPRIAGGELAAPNRRSPTVLLLARRPAPARIGTNR